MQDGHKYTNDTMMPVDSIERSEVGKAVDRSARPLGSQLADGQLMSTKKVSSTRADGRGVGGQSQYRGMVLATHARSRYGFSGASPGFPCYEESKAMGTC